MLNGKGWWKSLWVEEEVEGREGRCLVAEALMAEAAAAARLLQA